MINRNLKAYFASFPTPTSAVAAASLDLKSAAKRRRSHLLKPVVPATKPVQFSDSVRRKASLSSSPVKVVVRSARPGTRGAQSIALPAFLARPIAKDVDASAIEAVSPDLKGTPVKYVRDTLNSIGSRMLSVLASTSTTSVPAACSSSLPPAVSVSAMLPTSESSSLLPTHMLAVHSSSSAGTSTGPRKVTLFPTHAVVLAANCANLPTLPSGSSEETKVAESSIRGLGKQVDASLPLVPLALPSPETFAQLSTFLYTRRADQLLASIMPCPPPASSSSSSESGQDSTDRRESSLESYSHALTTLSKPTLLSHALRVHGLWRNACALGVHDERLWAVIDGAWTVLVRAMGKAEFSS